MSDGSGDFVECHGDAQRRDSVDAQLVEAAAQVLDEGVSGDHDLGCPIGLQSAINLSRRFELAGGMDDHVHPDHTLRLVDRLIAADKDFELRIVPGAEHIYIDCPAYVRKACWDFPVDEMTGTQPPGYRLAPIPVDPGLLASFSPGPGTRQLRARLGSLLVPVPPGGPAGPGRTGAG